MQLIRTTIRMNKQLKKEAERLALKQERTFQDIVNKAVGEYLKNQKKKQAKKIVFRTHDFGNLPDVIDRDFIYGDP